MCNINNKGYILNHISKWWFQNTEHIIPEDSDKTWVRGGLPSRQIMRNIDYEKRCEV